MELQNQNGQTEIQKLKGEEYVSHQTLRRMWSRSSLFVLNHYATHEVSPMAVFCAQRHREPRGSGTRADADEQLVRSGTRDRGRQPQRRLHGQLDRYARHARREPAYV